MKTKWPFEFLGHKQGKWRPIHYFRVNGNVIQWSNAHFRVTGYGLKKLAPFKFWKANYGEKNKINWLQALSDVIWISYPVGDYIPKKK